MDAGVVGSSFLPFRPEGPGPPLVLPCPPWPEGEGWSPGSLWGDPQGLRWEPPAAFATALSLRPPTSNPRDLGWAHPGTGAPCSGQKAPQAAFSACASFLCSTHSFDPNFESTSPGEMQWGGKTCLYRIHGECFLLLIRGNEL